MAGESVAELRGAVEEAARRAGKILADRFHSTRTIEFKGGIDLVTDADKASEAELLSFIQARFPSHTVLAEESGLTRGAAGGYRWIVDPLDGTTNYAHRVPHFCVSIAVEGPVEDGSRQLLAGAVLAPLSGELFSAGRGMGAHLNGAVIRVSETESLERSLLCTGFPYDIRERPEGPLGLFNRFIRRAQGIRRMGSAALDLAYVAAGRFDGFFEFKLKPWDIAAGALLVMEAGGAVARIDGEPLEVDVGDILASNSALGPLIRRECREFLAEIGYSVRG
jgi:myo-inositol-1(or 4)-monophosphatase